MIASINPANGEIIRTFEAATEAEIEAALARADAAWHAYRRTPLAARAGWLTAAAQILENEQDRLGRLMTLEMGKPIAAARAEAAKCALACRYYAEHGERLLADEAVDAGPGRAFIRYQPIGAVLAVMPWNFPFWQVFRFAAPALMAGNVGLLKHASNVPQCALAIEEIIRRAGFPADVFQTLLIGAAAVEGLINDRRVKAATLTGSEPAGIAVAAQAGRQIKKTVLELGGSDPFVVMASADLDRAVKTAVQARVLNNGQSCIAAKRFIVDARIADEFERRFVAGMAALRVGDPMDEATDVGPLATPAIVEEIEAQVSPRVPVSPKSRPPCSQSDKAQTCVKFGGAGGIRTLDRALQPYNGLANRRLQPLGHSSVRADMPDAGPSRKPGRCGAVRLRAIIPTVFARYYNVWAREPSLPGIFLP